MFSDVASGTIRAAPLASSAMEVRILGPLEVRGDRGPVSIDTPKERAVLEVLALRAGDLVEPDVLIDALWGPEPPRTAAKSLQSHISRLRRALPAGTVLTEAGRYRLVVEDVNDVDVLLFQRLIDAGRQALDISDHRRAAQLLERALDLWRGSPLADVAPGPLRDGQTVRLAELRVTALEMRIDALLGSGHHDAVVAELEALVAEHPLRERLWQQLMVALYRSGRRADSLAAYQRLRRLLREELGIDPSAAVRALELAILNEDSALELAEALPPATLPIPLTSFVGRERQVTELRKLLVDHRLVTLLGPGGAGKSRLAIEAARRDVQRWRDGVWWVELGDLDRSADLVPRFVRSLDITVPPGMTPVDALGWFISTRRLLLVIDNAERVVGELSVVVGGLLEGAAGVGALITSRIPLGVAGERRVVVGPLDVPAPGADGALASESMRLFLDRLAERDVADPTPEALDAAAELCRLSEGLPLAIELLAANAAARGPSGTLSDLTDRRDLLEIGGVPGGRRQSDLHHVLRSTVDLLVPTARRLFARLSVFRGSFDRDAARSITDEPDAIDDLDRLVDTSLVDPVDVVGVVLRYRLLDTTRAFASTLLDPAERQDAERRHAEFFRTLAIDAGAAMEGPDEQNWLEHVRQNESDIDVALRWWIGNEPSGALAFARGMGRAWYVTGDLVDTRDRLDEILAAARATDSPADRSGAAWAHLRLGWPRFLTGDVAGGIAEMDIAANGFQATDDLIGLARALAGRAHMTLLATGDANEALSTYERAIGESRRSGDPVAIAWCLVEAAQALILADRADLRVEEMLAEAEDVFAAAGDDVGLSHLFMDRVLAAYACDDLEELRRSAEEGIEHSRAAGHHVYEQILLIALGVRLTHLGDLVRSAEFLGDAAQMAFAHHNLLQLGIAFQAMAVHFAVTDEPVRAARLWGAAGRLSPVWPLYQRRYGELMAPAREALGTAFDEEVAVGATLTPEDALELGLGTEADVQA